MLPGDLRYILLRVRLSAYDLTSLHGLCTYSSCSLPITNCLNFKFQSSESWHTCQASILCVYIYGRGSIDRVRDSSPLPPFSPIRLFHFFLWAEVQCDGIDAVALPGGLAGTIIEEVSQVRSAVLTHDLGA